MNLLEAMAKGLARPDVSEFAVATGRLPCVKVQGSYQPVGIPSPSSSDIAQMLCALGGTSHMAELGPQAVTWRTYDSDVGALVVVAMRRDDLLQARFSLSKSDHPRSGVIEAAIVAPAPPAPDTGPSGLELDVGASVGGPAGRATLETLPDDKRVSISAAEAGPWSFDRLLGLARAKDASDLHVVAERPALLRIGGELVPFGDPISAAAAETMLLPIVPERLRASLADEGSSDFAMNHPEHGRFRVNVSRQRTGYKATLRLVGRSIPTLESLGLPAAIGQALENHQGLVMLTGPTGHGKTTTLAALVDRINAESTSHIITVEDPVEYVHPRRRAVVTQREVGTHTRSFAAAVKASLREDPDVIVVGELRDTETVRMAISASETGHLVLGTMNTPSAAKTIDRLIDLFPPADQAQVRLTLAGGLRLIVSQRLVRSADGTRVHAAAELLPGNIALWNLIREGRTFQIPSLQQRGKGLGIVRLDDSLAELVRAGKVTLDEACVHAELPDELRFTITGRRGEPAPHKEA